MKYTLNILRRERGSDESRRESFIFETESKAETVASALTFLNHRNPLKNSDGEISRNIEWECSCLQKKCGACAMVINGRPQLACAALLCECGENISVEPLRKFPVVCDLIVDRSILFENLKTMRLWLSEDADISEEYAALAYESSECLQCGCCLEICPNFYAGGRFFGMSAVPITMRLLCESDKKAHKEIAKQYLSHTFAGCGKSLACRGVCPKGIDTEKLLVNANAIAVWKRKKEKKK